jgi:hypothetical protein
MGEGNGIISLIWYLWSQEKEALKDYGSFHGWLLGFVDWAVEGSHWI